MFTVFLPVVMEKAKRKKYLTSSDYIPSRFNGTLRA